MEIVKKGWGYEKIICNSEFCGKLLHFNKGKRLSFHRHFVKEEYFYLHEGKLLLKYGYDDDIEKTQELILMPGDSFHVPPGLCHQLIALEESNLFEFSTHHEDSDSKKIIVGDQL
jgi:mannose-6-phosphate isomerase-like protein (cupin superfamily)